VWISGARRTVGPEGGHASGFELLHVCRGRFSEFKSLRSGNVVAGFPDERNRLSRSRVVHRTRATHRRHNTSVGYEEESKDAQIRSTTSRHKTLRLETKREQGSTHSKIETKLALNEFTSLNRVSALRALFFNQPIRPNSKARRPAGE
jgi:hypothetical protein